MRLIYIHFHTTGFQNRDDILRVGIMTHDQETDEISEEAFHFDYDEATMAEWPAERQRGIEYCGYVPGKPDQSADARQKVLDYIEQDYLPVISGSFGARFLAKLTGLQDFEYIDAAEVAKLHKIENPQAGATMAKVAAFYGGEIDNTNPLSMLAVFYQLTLAMGVPEAALRKAEHAKDA